MFDLGFVEMLVIGLILLLVVGPERLPEVARTVGGWVHEAKQYFESMKDQLDRETRFSELQSQIKGESGGGAASSGPSDEAGEASGAGDRESAPQEGAEATEPTEPDLSGRSAEEGEAADSLERELDDKPDPDQDSGHGRG
jgi:sec-independent protein translocase protein TatB